MTGAALAFAAAAVVLLSGGASQARAAIAGAPGASTTDLPDLVSAQATGQSSMQVCFDKALSSASAVFNDPDDLLVDDYVTGGSGGPAGDDYSPTTVTAAPSNALCLNAQFDPQAGQLSLGEGTVVTSEAGAVTAAAGGGQSLADSTSLTTSTSHVGTAGFSDAPDLSSSAVYTGAAAGLTNAIVFTFDQTVDINPSNADASNFFFETSSGSPATTSIYYGTAATASGNTVTVQFGGSAPSVQNGLQTGVLGGAVEAATHGSGYEPSSWAANVPLTGAGAGTVSIPSLVSASWADDYQSIKFVFDHQLSSTFDPGQFHVIGTPQEISTANYPQSSVSGNTVTIYGGTFFSQIAEYDVRVTVDGGAVSDAATGTGGNTPGGVAVGGNAGAFARGFTSGPDVESAIALGGGLVQVTVDQRINGPLTSSELGDIDLLNAAGQAVDVAQASVESNAPPPGPEVIDLQFSPTITTGTQIQFNVGAMQTPFGYGYGGGNVPQIVSISGGSAARVRAVRAGHHRRRPRTLGHRRF